MLFLIDGYNLMHALGVLHGRTGPRGLEHARRRLLDFLLAGHADESIGVTVVFDAKNPPPRAEAEATYHGLRIVFARHQDEADDLIEEMIRRAPQPKALTVVSDDRRLRAAAHRRHCHAWTCGEYLDFLQQARPSHVKREPTADLGKPEPPTAEEADQWLEEFRDIDGWDY